MPDALFADAAALARAEADGPTDRIDALVRTYLDAAELHDVTVFTPADVAGAVLGNLRSVGERTSGAVSVRVFNPSRETDGWQSPHTIVEVVTDDMPFLIDSVSIAIAQHGYDIHLLFHPRFGDESHLHVEIDRETDAERIAALRDELVDVIDDVVAVVRDWQPTRERVLARAESLRQAPPATADAADVAEAATFLEWLADDHFTFVSAWSSDLATGADATLRPTPGSELGIARRRPSSELLQALDPQPYALTLTKGADRSTVHRAARLDSVGVKRFDAMGAVVGEDRFLGLYTASVYSESTDTIPVLRRKVARVLERAGLPPAGHDGRALVHILETYPRDELFRLSVDELFEITNGILQMGERRRVRLFVSCDDHEGFVSCLVYLPRDRYTTTVQIGVTEALQRAFAGVGVDFTVLVGDDTMARLHVVVDRPARGLDVDLTALETELGLLVRTWTDDLRDALVHARGEEEGLDTLRAWSEAFPVAYQVDVRAADAVTDLKILEGLDPSGGLELRLDDPSRDGVVRAKLYRSGAALVLSDIMPLLEHLGVTVVDERPYEIVVPGGERRWIYAFGVSAAPGDPLTGQAVQARVAELFLGVWAGAIENDGLNRLVLRCGLASRDIVIVRALCKYLRQAGIRFAEDYLAETLAGNADSTKLVVELFHARFDPDRPRDDAAVDEITAELTRSIDAVAGLDADRILRALMHVVLAAVRTNVYQRQPDGTPKPYVAIKLDPALLDFLPPPRPRHEIWVYSPRVEGVHLRAGYVARGGIRWSDRREDFRTEVLGLMKAQTVKNSVIVPVGAKGGFVVKQPGTGAAATPATKDQVLASYQTFIRGLLDLTDNLVDGAEVPPDRVVRYDAHDSYLVVAADKGTAAFSDVANALAAEYGFWLGDAFASGGSSGFDHKALGITSRGVWISVQAHFRALGVDADRAELTVVGIGDMSGDVFGNGLLRSPHVKLLAAFDHRHVFVDPNPDPAASYAERQRLFSLPGSSWADYDPHLISAGGGVFPRTAKAVPLSAEAREALGIATETLTPDELVSAVLRAPVDLLWNGGVGTFVKATTESSFDVGDRSNDGVRVDATELRCRVVAEGGNLGFTQRARVEFALSGGRINTDAIDNSAGVDASDHEVNVKILLQGAITGGLLAAAGRDQRLVRMTDEVAELVLADNTAQANALEIAAVEAAEMVGVHARQMERLVQRGHLDRVLEALPTAKVLQERHAAGLGLTAPELAVLLAITKLELDRALVDSDVPDDPYLHADLVAYFPAEVRGDLGTAIDQHPLRREIIATVVANAVVNRAGISFLSRLNDETGIALPELTRAHVVARDVFGAVATWTAIDALDLAIPAAVQDAMFLAVRRLVERAARWLVRHQENLELGPSVERFRVDAQAIVAGLPDLLVGEAATALDRETARLGAAGVPAALATLVATSEAAVAALPLSAVASAHREDPLAVARLHFVLADRLGLDWLRLHIAALPKADRWQTEARAALRDDFYESQRALTEAALGATQPATAPEQRADEWLLEHRAEVARYRQVVDDIETAGSLDLAALAVGRRALRELAGID